MRKSTKKKIFITIPILLIIGFVWWLGFDYEGYKSLSKEIVIDSETIDSLIRIKEADKFNEEFYYPGASSETTKEMLSKIINESIDNVIIKIKNPPTTKKDILGIIELGLDQVDKFYLDTEDRERFCGYYQQIIFTVGLEDSYGLLNSWLYGDLLVWFMNAIDKFKNENDDT